MNSQSTEFNKTTQPNYYPSLAMGTEYSNIRSAVVPPKFTHPIPDARYPAYAGMAEDARFGTDYRPHCTQNMPAGTQFTTKQWMIRHATDIMDISRRRQSEWTGAALPMANTVPPPADIVHSTPFDSEIQPSGAPFGIGVERSDAKAPGLFGTFSIPPTDAERRLNGKNIALTTRYEGGRNSPRGGPVPRTAATVPRVANY